MILSFLCARSALGRFQHWRKMSELSLVTRLIIGVLVDEDPSMEGPFHLRAILEFC